MGGHQVFIAAVTVSELRYGALVADWGQPRRDRLEEAIRTTTVVPVTDALLTVMAELRHACRVAGHPLHDRARANDLWIAASAVHIGARLLTADSVLHRRPRPHAPPVAKL
jgi:tRNA(fMet)-specific endonuclease VapC